MTRLQQARLRREKLRATQNQLENAFDCLIPSLQVLPSAAFEALLVYAIDGLLAQGTVYDKDHALRFVSHALTKRGLI